MPSALLTYLGEPDKSGEYEFYAEDGTSPWHVGEERIYALDHGLLFEAAFNMNLKHPRFSLDEMPDEPTLPDTPDGHTDHDTDHAEQTPADTKEHAE